MLWIGFICNIILLICVYVNTILRICEFKAYLCVNCWKFTMTKDIQKSRNFLTITIDTIKKFRLIRELAHIFNTKDQKISDLPL